MGASAIGGSTVVAATVTIAVYSGVGLVGQIAVVRTSVGGVCGLILVESVFDLSLDFVYDVGHVGKWGWLIEGG